MKIFRGRMIYFVRHGQTDYNLKKLYAGQKDIPLNEEGVRQAKQTASQLKDIPFDVCYCSPLIRARQTCDEILKLHEKNIPVFYDERLKERDYGKLADLPVGSVPFKRWKVGADEDLNAQYQIEPIMQVYKRMKEFFDDILKCGHKKILVVAHSGVGQIGSAYFYGMPDDMDFSSIKIPNGGVMIFE